MSTAGRSGYSPTSPDLRGACCQGGPETTVLAADDDMFFRGLTETLLSESGYNVITAEDGEDAVHKFRANQDRIHLVILDVMMPGKNGCQAYEEMREMRPGVKVLFATGHSREYLERTGMVGSGLDLILKPMSPLEFLHKVREILDR